MTTFFLVGLSYPPIKPDVNGKICEPGKPFKYQCNYCFCSPNGTIGGCTKIMCDPNVWNDDGTLKN